MRTYNKVTPEGTKDLLFEECLIHRAVERKLTAVFAARGFHEVVTPGMEFMDVFDPEVSGIAPEIMYKMSDRRGRLIVMRPDSTMPIARLAATRLQKEEKPLRLYYTQRIYRNHPNLTGAQRRSAAGRVELLGAGGKRADLEAICTAVESLLSCTPDFRLELGHAGFFRAIADGLPITADQREEIRSLIESKNYAALESLLDGLERTPAVEAMRRLPRLFGGEGSVRTGRAAVRQRGSRRHARIPALALQEPFRAWLGNRLMVDLGWCSGTIITRASCSAPMRRTAATLSCSAAGMTIFWPLRSSHARHRLFRECGRRGQAARGAGVCPECSRRKSSSTAAPARGEGAAVCLGVTSQGGSCETSVFETEEESIEYARRRGIPNVAIVGQSVKEYSLADNTEIGGDQA